MDDNELAAFVAKCAFDTEQRVEQQAQRIRELEAERDQWQESCGQNYVRATKAEAREERLREAIEPVLRLVEFELRGNPNRELPPWKEPIDRLRKALEGE